MNRPAAAAHRKTRPTCEVMKGQMMYSPEEMPHPTSTTVGPTIFLNGGAGGMSRYSSGGRFLLGASGA